MSEGMANRGKGDPRAFAKLVEEHYRPVYGLAFSAVGNWQAAEDVAQDAFLVAWVNLGKLRRLDAFGAWIRRIARNLSRNWIRSERYRRDLLERRKQLAAASDANGVAADEKLAESDRRAEIWRALETLSPALREAVVLYYLEERSVAQTASALGVSENTVKKRLQHARPKLRGYFEKQWQAEMEHERRRMSRREARERFLAGAAIGPVSRLAIGTGAGAGISSAAGEWAKILTAGLAVLVVVGAGVTTRNVLHTRSEEGKPDFPGAAEAESLTGQASQNASEPAKNIGGPAAGAETPVPILPAPVERAGGETPGAVAPETAAPAPAEDEEPDPAATVTIRGRVVDKESQPIAGASVTVIHLANNQRFALETGSDGEFSVADVPEHGNVTIQAGAPGYCPEAIFSSVKHATRVTIVLARGFEVEGRVLNARGRPVTDARLQITALAGERGSRGRSWQDWLTTQTDEEGRFALTVEQAGRAVIPVRSVTEGEATFSDVWLEAGGFVELQYPTQSSVCGRISESDGAPAAGKTVRLTGFTEAVESHEGGSSSASFSHKAGEAITDAEGAYEISRLDPRLYYRASVFDEEDNPLATNVEIGAPPEGHALVWNYTLPGLITVKGVARVQNSALPAAGIDILCRPANETGERLLSVAPVKATTDTSGSFELCLTAGAGAYMFGIDAAGGFYAVSQKQFRAGEAAVVNLVVPGFWTRVFCVVDELGDPVANAIVNQIFIMPGGGQMTKGRAELTDGDGRFVAKGPVTGEEIMYSFSYNDCRVETPSFIAEEAVELPEETVVLELHEQD